MLNEMKLKLIKLYFIVESLINLKIMLGLHTYNAVYFIDFNNHI